MLTLSASDSKNGGGPLNFTSVSMADFSTEQMSLHLGQSYLKMPFMNLFSKNFIFMNSLSSVLQETVGQPM